MNQHYSCNECTATCTFEAMQMCQLDTHECPVIADLNAGTIVDRRLTDFDPTFPSHFTYASEK